MLRLGVRQFEIDAPIVIDQEQILPVVAPLRDMTHRARDGAWCNPCHKCIGTGDGKAGANGLFECQGALASIRGVVDYNAWAFRAHAVVDAANVPVYCTMKRGFP
jgi:hypothetical protein